MILGPLASWHRALSIAIPMSRGDPRGCLLDPCGGPTGLACVVLVGGHREVPFLDEPIVLVTHQVFVSDYGVFVAVCCSFSAVQPVPRAMKEDDHVHNRLRR